MSGDLVGVLADEQLQSTCTVILSPVVFMTILVLYAHLDIVPIAVCMACGTYMWHACCGPYDLSCLLASQMLCC